MKLVKLPNGEWIKAELVLGIESCTDYSTTPNAGFVKIKVKDRIDAIKIYTANLENAEGLRDVVANNVNKAL